MVSGKKWECQQHKRPGDEGPGKLRQTIRSTWLRMMEPSMPGTIRADHILQVLPMEVHRQQLKGIGQRPELQAEGYRWKLKKAIIGKLTDVRMCTGSRLFHRGQK